jgi:hypothetical protein
MNYASGIMHHPVHVEDFISKIRDVGKEQKTTKLSGSGETQQPSKTTIA